MRVRQLLSTLQSILRSHWMCGGLLRGTAAPMQLQVATCLCTLLAKCNHHKQPFALLLKHSYPDVDPWRCRDCRGSWGVKLLARAVYQLHRLHQKLRRAVGPHPRLLWPLSRCIALGSQQLSKRLLLACEVAMELMLSLTYAHQVQWLQRHRPSHQLLTEVHEQSQKVHTCTHACTHAQLSWYGCTVCCAV